RGGSCPDGAHRKTFRRLNIGRGEAMTEWSSSPRPTHVTTNDALF
ncbi:MAG: hypothetical protein ACI81R_003169, partial [Bradymonadia bacterium]